jgi:hypothetical protein
MSIDAKEFDKHKHLIKYILDFLRNNSNRAFTVECIAKEIGVGVSEVNSALLWNNVAAIIDPQHTFPVEYATVRGVLYYKYKGQ